MFLRSQISDLYYICILFVLYSFTLFTFYRYITNSIIGSIIGSKPVQAWLVFLGFNFTTDWVACIIAIINHVFTCFSAVQIYDLSYIHLQYKYINYNFRTEETAPTKLWRESILVENNKLNFMSNRSLVLLVVNIPTLRGPMFSVHCVLKLVLFGGYDKFIFSLLLLRRMICNLKRCNDELLKRWIYKVWQLLIETFKRW